MSSRTPEKLRLLYFTAEQWPTFRPDIVTLFGKYLPREGINSDLVTERDSAISQKADIPWPGGRSLLCNVPKPRAGQYLVKLWHNLRVLITIDAKEYDAIQVRDLSLTALVALVVAKVKGIRFFYWLSFPQSEGQIDRASTRGIRRGMRFFFPLVQGTLGKWLLYQIILPNADHIFVQSHQMQIEIALKGISMTNMTSVPMGVDTETASLRKIFPVHDVCHEGKRVVIYLGTLDAQRKIEILFQMLVYVREAVPNILLVLAGDTSDSFHLEWLKNEAARLGVIDLIQWTGWLDVNAAWSYARSAEVGLSPIPRGYLLDMGSPTKAIEYMALGLPVLGNDNPDQSQVILESGGGLCVELEPRVFAESLISLLADRNLRDKMAEAGQHYVNRVRGYNTLARSLAKKYYCLLSRKNEKLK